MPFNEKKNPTVLIVDDDNVTRMTLAKVLENSDYNVIVAKNGLQGLEMFGQHRPDMVLMDVMMPEMDGYESCQHIRKISDAEVTPIIMLTGLNDVTSVEKAFDAGATDFITKPINWPLLNQRVRYAMRASAMYSDLRKQQTQLVHAQRIARLGYFEYLSQSNTVILSDQILNIIGNDLLKETLSYQEFVNLVPKEDQQRLDSAMQQALKHQIPYNIDHRISCGNNTKCIVHHHGEPSLDSMGNVTGIAATLQDITDRKAAEALIEYQKYHDPITGLPNRVYLTEQLDALMNQAETNETLLAIMLFHIERFREVNDTLGHRVGDQLLRNIADELKDYFGNEYIIARFDGATFAFVSTNTRHIDDVTILAQQLLDILSQPRIIHDHELFVKGSIGISLHPMESDNKEMLLKCADNAMSRARESGGDNYQFYSSEMNKMAESRLKLEADLRKAIERDELCVYYQPQVKTQTRDVVGMEALIRWQHPERGLLQPLDFIPLAEETGLISSIGSWVMRDAITQTRQWHKQGYMLRIGINLSAVQFNNTNLLGEIETIIEETGIDPSYVDLEITESIAMNDFEATLDILHRIKAMGIKTSIDDFGTGHSSLSYLQRMPVHTLKIDRAFIKDIGKNGENGVLAKAIIAMAHSLELNVIAEGIETEEHYQFLKNNNCNELQGYLFSLPLPQDQFEEYISKQKIA